LPDEVQRLQVQADQEKEENDAEMSNLLDVMEDAACDLRHISVVQGGKYYGRHLGPIPTPARETDPRHMPPNFYFDQEDHLLARQTGKRKIRQRSTAGFIGADSFRVSMTRPTYRRTNNIELSIKVGITHGKEPVARCPLIVYIDYVSARVEIMKLESFPQILSR